MISKDWLKIGLNIWSEANPDRENVILLPNDDYTSFKEEGVEPGDRAALTRLALEAFGLANAEDDEDHPRWVWDDYNVV